MKILLRLVVPGLIVLVGCSKEEPTPAAPPEAGASASPAAKAKPTSVEKNRVSTKVKRGGKEISFSVELPKGLKNVDDSPYSKQFARSEADEDGYGFLIGFDAYKRTYEDEKERYQQTLVDVPEKKAKSLGDGDYGGRGYWVAASFEKGGARALTISAKIVKGDAVLTCEGDVYGPEAQNEQAALVVLRDTCGSIQID